MSPSNVPEETRKEGKMWQVLENNPEVMNPLASKLGLSSALQFYDIYSLNPDPSLTAHIPRPAIAMLAIIPLTEPWQAERVAEDSTKPYYNQSGPDEPVIWFRQTIGNACGSIGLLHCAINATAAVKEISPGSTLDQLRKDAIPLGREARAQMLYDSGAFEEAHKSVSHLGDTIAPPASDGHQGHHFVAFVKAADGHLWELEGSRKGPVDRGFLEADEDVLSPRAIEIGIGRVIKLVKDAGVSDLRFSCTVLAPAT